MYSNLFFHLISYSINFFSRAFCEEVMGDTLSELIQNCSFQSLVESVEREKLKKAKLQETIQKLVY